MTAVKWGEILESFEFVGFDAMGGHEAFVCRETGAIFWHSEFGDELDELPDDIEDGKKYIRLPDRKELDLGMPLVLAFTAEFLPDDVGEVRRLFSRKGAYGRFKDFLEQRRVLDRWYAFEAEATEKALREWCEVNGIAIEG